MIAWIGYPGEDESWIEPCEGDSASPDGNKEEGAAPRYLDLDSGMGMGVAAEVRVDVASSVSRASSIAVTHSCTSCGVDA